MKGKRVWSILLVVLMLAAMMPAAVQAAMFQDIAGHWAEADIEDAVERELFQGTSDTTFSPDIPMTRGMFVTVLCRADYGWSEEPEPFVDVSEDDWYYDAVCWANEFGLVRGTDASRFSPNDPISREQMVTILYRYLDYAEAELAVTTDAATIFRDQSSISAYAEEAVEAMQYAEIINGRPAEGGGYVFDPQGKATRAEVARVFCCFLDAMYWPDDDDPDDGELPDPDDVTEMAEFINETLSIVEYWYEDGDNDYILMEDLPDALKEMKEMADWWEEDGLIRSSNVNEDNICLTLNNGLLYMYVPDVYELRETAGSVQTYEPYANSDSDFEKYQARYGYLDAGARSIAAADSNYPFTVDLDEPNVTIDEVLKIGKDSIVLWYGHGNYDSKAGSVLWTSDHLVGDRDVELWGKYNGLVLLGRKDTGATGTRLGVTAQFFDSYFTEGSLSGSLFWLATCSSHQDDKLAAALRGKGAVTVIGSSWSIGKNYLARVSHYFAQRLTTKQSDGSYYTAGEALDYAKDQAGALDRDWTAVMELTGSSSFRLNGATLDVLVVDSETNTLVSDARIKVEDRSFTGRTDENGKAVLSGLQSETEYTVTASKEGYETASGTTRIGYTKGSITLYLKPEAVDRSGKVKFELQDEEGNPLTGVTGSVTIYENGSKTDRLSPLFTSSELTVQALEPGKTYEFRFEAEGYLTSKVEGRATASPTTPIPVTMKKKSSSSSDWSVSLTVQDAVSQSGISGAAVTVSGAASESGPFTAISSVTAGSGGRLSITVPGEYEVVRLEVSADGYISRSMTKTRSIIASTTISLTPENAAGDEDDEYVKIYSGSEFGQLQGDEKVKLMRDISLEGVSISFPVWFGELEGNGYRITGISFEPSSAGNQGANGHWLSTNRGSIRNVTFSGVSITGSNTNASTSYSKAALFYTNYGSLENCILQGKISALGGRAEAGGFVIYNYGAIRNCSNQAEITAVGTGSGISGRAAGIALTNSSDPSLSEFEKGIITGCGNQGTITVQGSSLAESSGAGITLTPGSYTGCSNSGTLSVTNGLLPSSACYDIAPTS